MKTLQRLSFDGVLKCALDALFHYMAVDRGCASADHAAVRGALWRLQKMYEFCANILAIPMS
jgi:hypothetical protein